MRLPFIFVGESCFLDEWTKYGLARNFLVTGGRTRGSWRPLATIAELADVYFQFIHRATESIAVHPELPRGEALIALVILKDSRDKAALEFADRL